MSNFKIKFRDQQTGRQVELDAQQVKGSWNETTTDTSFDNASVGDGKVDVMVKEDRWFWQYNRHLGVDTNNLSPDDAAALKRALENPSASNLEVFNMMTGRVMQGLNVVKTDAAGELSDVTPNLDPTGTRRPVQFTPSGHIATPEGNEPQTLSEVGEGMFRAASLIDDVKGNLFDETQTSLPLKEKMFANIQEARAEVTPGAQPPQGMDGTQSLQLRSSTATTALELMTSTENTSEDFQMQVFEEYKGWIQNETNPLLKDSMVFNLHRLKDKLPASIGSEIDSIREAHAPTKPPYEKWFADGNNTVNVDWSVGIGEGFLEDNVAHLKSKGFKVVEERNGYPVMEKTYEKNGVETGFQITFRPHRTDMFDTMGDDDKTHVSIYSGHSNWGRNVRSALEGSPQGSGDGKLMMTNLCVGKGELQMMRDAYPDAHMITTYNSGYFRPGNDAEWHYAVDELFDGIAERRGYEHIAEDTRKANPWTWTHRSEGIDNNYIFPTDLEIRRQVLDQDHDGQADVFDRMVNFNSFDVQTDTQREFQPIEPSRSTDSLVGTKVHFAAMSTNRISIYNELLHERNGKGEVIPAGYHEPMEGDTGLFRFERNEDGLVAMSMDADYAHMSEEALRMASAFEYSMFKASEGGDWPLHNRTDNLLHAMVFASQSLNSDTGYRDSAIWKEFLSAYNLPDIPLNSVSSTREADKHWYSGSHKSISVMKDKIDGNLIEALADPNVGVLTHDE
ncbi:MAG: hypothetical protein EP343_13770 [Deltaproteobacteria bacterium]|nr:MAG: hypothetical protein EP343_13770 [Deltaproteobacteria bacterium]